MKKCGICEVEKDSSEFYSNKKIKDGLNTYCKPCVNEYNKKSRAERHKDPEYRQRDLDSKSENHYKRRHGMTRKEREEFILSKGSVCGICKTTDPENRGWQIDHDHSCCPKEYSCKDCRRGILCVRCNTAIGLFGDNVDSIRSAISYLDSFTLKK